MAIALDTLAYARRLREAGFSEKQAEGQADALAAAMSDSLATKQNLRETEARLDARFAQVDARFAQMDARFSQIDTRFEYLERHLDTRLAELEKRMEVRFSEHTARFEGRLTEQVSSLKGELVDLERRMTLRLGGMTVAGIGVMSALAKLL